MDTNRDEIRCGQCARKLAVGQYVKLQIKCPRCGTLNSYSTLSATPLERPRTSNSTMKDVYANSQIKTEARKEPRAQITVGVGGRQVTAD